MRIPQTPPDRAAILARKAGQALSALSDAALRPFLTDAQTGYWHWDKVRRVARDRGWDPEVAWFGIKLARMSGARSTRLVGHGGVPITFTTPDIVQQETMLIDQQLAGHIGLAGGAPLNHDTKERFIASSLMEEAIASSMLEGAATTVRVAKEMLRQNRKPRTHGERMVHNNYLAIQFMRERLDRPLSKAMLLELQSILTDSTLEAPAQVGRLRRPDEQVVVRDSFGETVHTPPDAAELESRIESLCAFANAPDADAADGFVHPFVRASILHFMIGFDHPFCDGNGRTARAVFYWSMLRRGYWLFEFLPISRLIYKSPGQYGRAYLYTETDDFDATYFVVYHARIVSQARRDLAEYIKSKQVELATARVRFSTDPGLNDRQHALLMHATEHPNSRYTIESHQNSHRVAYATARADLMALVDAGYLAMKKVGKRFVFTPSEKLSG